MAHTEFENQPWQQHQTFLVNGLKNSPVVSSLQVHSRFHYAVQRPGKGELRLYLTNKYILSVADVMEILDEAPDVNCIVSTMSYNQYSPEADEYCRGLGVGLFKTTELFGAVYYDGNRFLDYMPPERGH